MSAGASFGNEAVVYDGILPQLDANENGCELTAFTYYVDLKCFDILKIIVTSFPMDMETVLPTSISTELRIVHDAFFSINRYIYLVQFPCGGIACRNCAEVCKQDIRNTFELDWFDFFPCPFCHPLLEEDEEGS